MSAGTACTDSARHRKYWRVVQRQCNHSAFNGYRRTYSDYSTVICMAPAAIRGTCAGAWRTKAAYVTALPDATDAERRTFRVEEPTA